MQIIRTEIAEATALSGEPILRVLFCGEGGDCVTVDMASVEAGSDDAALDRARAILGPDRDLRPGGQRLRGRKQRQFRRVRRHRGQ
jgi:hypothetical protein